MPILAAPYTPPPPPPPPPPYVPVPPVVDWGGLVEQRWTGWDGSEWVMSGRSSGVRFGPNLRGHDFPPVTDYSTVSPGVAGSRSRGFRTQDREVYWQVQVYNGGGSQAWIEYDRAFWKTLQPGKPGTWTVVHPDGTARTLVCTAQHGGDRSSPWDASRIGWATYPQTLIARQPYWAGEPVVRTWRASPVVNFLDPLGSPPFHISSGSAFVGAVIDNPGDVETYPLWTLTGPITSASIGVNGRVFVYNVAIPDGQTRTIDTRPDKLTVVDQAGADKLADLGQAEFVPVPAGISVPLTLSVVGTGMVSMSLTPYYHRAW